MQQCPISMRTSRRAGGRPIVIHHLSGGLLARGTAGSTFLSFISCRAPPINSVVSFTSPITGPGLDRYRSESELQIPERDFARTAARPLTLALKSMLPNLLLHRPFKARSFKLRINYFSTPEYQRKNSRTMILFSRSLYPSLNVITPEDRRDIEPSSDNRALRPRRSASKLRNPFFARQLKCFI